MRDLVAGIVAVLLLLSAASLATTLRSYRRRRQRARDSEGALGRVVIAELPTADDLVLVSQDDQRFYYGERASDKGLCLGVRVLSNRPPRPAARSRRHAAAAPLQPTRFEDRPEGIARD